VRKEFVIPYESSTPDFASASSTNCGKRLQNREWGVKISQKERIMSFVTQLDIKEFRGIKSCKEPLKFSKFNVLLGRNNSGKSAVLQALSLLPHPFSKQPMGINIGGDPRTGLIRHLTGHDDSIIYRYAGEASLDFEFEDKKYHISLTKGGVREISGQGKGFPPYEPAEACRYLGIEPKESQNWAVFVPNDSQFLKVVEERLSADWQRVEKSESHIEVIREVINPVIDEKFTEVTRRDSALYVRKEIEGKPSYVNVRDLGDGVEKTLNILLFLDFCVPKLVLWDDFELSAHPSLVKSLLQWLNKREWQVVLATHSIDVLYELVEINPQDCTIVQLKKTGDDILVRKNLTVEEVEDYLSANNDPRFLVDLIEIS
jgi:energy-coupling factor transporter ATP-binding protein EcfA2